MKQLLFLRHGKSDWGTELGSDHERLLNDRGERAARQVGHFLTCAELVPDRVVTSSAVRARRTAELAMRAGEWVCPLEVTHELYEATPEAVLGVIRRQDDAVERLLLVGHEPTWSELASRLAGGGRLKMVTAALVCLELGVRAWEELKLGDGVLLWMLPPRLLERLGLGGRR